MRKINSKIWLLPWQGKDVPHALLDILRGCNLHCQACYNYLEPSCKSLQEVKDEVEAFLRLRRLQSISIVGGEPLLHPDLLEIVRFLRQKKLRVELFTNAVCLDAARCADLKKAGVDLVFLHIDSGQDRPDWASATQAERHRLIAEKAALVIANGMEAGLIVTAYPDALDEVCAGVQLTLDSEDIDYLLVTRFRKHDGIVRVGGDIETGVTASVKGATHTSDACLRSHSDMQQMLFERFSFLPFAGVPSNRDPTDIRWLSYLIGTVHRAGRRCAAQGIRACLCERAFSALHRGITGRYPFFVRKNPTRFKLQLVLNALLGGHVSANMRLLCAAVLPGRSLHAKRLLFQNPAEVDERGVVTHCNHCPDATLKDGTLIPVCLADLKGRGPASCA
jgi:hypothetical protein